MNSSFNFLKKKIVYEIKILMHPVVSEILSDKQTKIRTELIYLKEKLLKLEFFVWLKLFLFVILTQMFLKKNKHGGNL